MTWMFSQALIDRYESSRCSRGQEEASSQESSLGGKPSVPSSKTPTQQAFLWQDKTTDTWSRFPSGMTSAPLTDDRGRGLLTWYLEASRAKTSPSPTPKERASKEPEAVCGRRWHALYQRYDPATSTWKTAQTLFDEVLDESSLTFPRWGMMRDGELWGRTTLPPLTSETASGLWPTPSSTAGGRRAPKGSKIMGGLTPTAYKDGKKYQVGLDQAVHWFPTPTSRDYRSGSMTQRDKGESSKPLSEKLGGCLHADWVEWLMGWPIGWTKMESLRSLDEWGSDDWWKEEKGLPRLKKGQPDRVSRIKCLGNGQVPAAAVLAWKILSEET